MTLRVLPFLVGLSIIGLVAWAARIPIPHVPAQTLEGVATTPPPEVITALDNEFVRQWREQTLQSAPVATPLTVLRRLSLSLMGTIPSLEEIREFEADAGPNRIARWTQRYLDDQRFADYFAVRLSRALVGAEVGQLFVFRRDRFNTWLSEQLQQNRPYDQMVREMIAAKGLWTGEPATNFITAAVKEETILVNDLAGRTARVFLGQRIDCAECHDHPFAEWKQSQFAGLAACFSETGLSPVGLQDGPRRGPPAAMGESTNGQMGVPQVPFERQAWPNDGTLRERLAIWVTHPENRRFERATVNRIWGLMFSRPWSDPVDDLPNPPTADMPHDVLDLLGKDFREHGYDLKRLISTIVALQVFQLDSRHPSPEREHSLEGADASWAVFPLAQLRPEQIIGSMLQAWSIRTMDQNSNLLSRVIRLLREIDFVREYGDYGGDELGEHPETIPQALLRMNGEFVQQISAAAPGTASGRIAGMAPTDETCLETCFLVILTRRPNDAERAHFLPLLEAAGRERGPVVEDIFWALFNSPEFCWNH